MWRGVAACFAALSLAGSVHAATLRIGLNEDPDALDPARGGSFVGRVVFAAVCDKLVDIDAQNNFVPQLATSWAWSPDSLALTVTLRDGVTFHDGEAMDADAVKANIERYRTAPESLRKGELKPVSSMEVVDPRTVRLHLSQPYAPLVAVLADRAGMMISPNLSSSPSRLIRRRSESRIDFSRLLCTFSTYQRISLSAGGTAEPNSSSIAASLGVPAFDGLSATK